MGYQRKRKLYQLVFAESEDLAGLEITVEALTLGELRDLQNSDELGLDRWKIQDREIETLDAH
jgi:hypothetical protein